MSAEFHPYSGTEMCSHCYATAMWRIVATGMTDYECNDHLLVWWSVELQEAARGNNA